MDDSARPSAVGCSRYQISGFKRILLHDDAGTDEDYYYTHRELWTPTGLLNKQGHYVERYVYDAYGKATIVATPTADFNFDGVVNGTDYSTIYSYYTQSRPVCTYGSKYDLDADGLIDADDVMATWDQWQAGLLNTEIPASAVGNPYFFTGRSLDLLADGPTGDIAQVYYYRARIYGPDEGRFGQREPLGYVDGMDLYLYARNSPSIYADPTGNQAQPIPVGPPPPPLIHHPPVEEAAWKCVIKRVGQSCFSVCTRIATTAGTVAAAGAVVLTFTTPCGDAEIPPLPEDDPNGATCRERHRRWGNCREQTDFFGDPFPFKDPGSAWNALADRLKRQQRGGKVSWDYTTERPLDNSSICGHLDGRVRHATVTITCGRMTKKGRYSVQCCSCCEDNGTEGQRCRYKRSSGTF